MMLKSIIKYLPLATLFFIFNSCKQETKEVGEVKQVFENYKNAILNDRGEEAVQLLDSRTIKYYTDILETAKTADSIEVNSLPFMDKLMVLSIRFMANEEEILSFDGRSIVVWAIEQGMVGKNTVANKGVGDVQIDGTFAKGQLMANGQTSPYFYNFYFEDNKWKLNLTSLFDVATTGIKQIIAESGLTENEFLLKSLEMSSGKTPDNSIWNKIVE